ncbi:MFS transporter [Leuconostoc citreum]|uniref:MFS transporter n=2 Tax=Leuconostoc citreum TaxID=33964 RepID=UPI00209CA5C9|nr:MFS transporter [Leuconostoc citreum]MCP1275848.1 MFS transporter [Leuconostoc citreum]
MNKKHQAIIAILATLVLVGISMITAVGTNATNEMKLNSTMLLASVSTVVIISVIIGALINKLFIWLSQLGQEDQHTVSFLTSWYAGSISALPMAIVNVFAITVLTLYKSGNTSVNIISSIISAIIYTLILRKENVITKRTQIIYFVIIVVLTVAMNVVTKFAFK